MGISARDMDSRGVERVVDGCGWAVPVKRSGDARRLRLGMSVVASGLGGVILKCMAERVRHA